MSSKPAEMAPPESTRITELKSEIRELGGRVDSNKARTAGAMGGAVFLLLLGVGGGYDLVNGNHSISVAVGVSQALFKWVVILLGSSGLFLLAVAFLRESKRDRSVESRLAELEEELADLLEQVGSA